MSVEDLKNALAKKADAAKTNENDTQKGVADVREPPPDRAPGTLDAHWGDKPAVGPRGDPSVYGTSVEREAKDTRMGVLDRIFDSPRTSASAEKSVMDAYFEHANEGQPHSPLLQRGHKTASADEPTLTDKVNRVIGFR